MFEHESAENYLEAILILQQRNEKVRSIDLANFFGYTKPSVSRAVKLLVQQGLLKQDPNIGLELTKSGLEKAKEVYGKHTQIKQFFMQVLGVEETIAEKDACRIEHVISPETFFKMNEYLKKIM